MFRLWIKLMKDNKIYKDITVENSENDTRTHKVFRGLEEACSSFDIARPIWLDMTIEDFKRTKKARFTQDNFMEPIDFDYLELQVLEEDCIY
ncbi:MAG: hypothetical protein PUE21_00580 [Lachnospiraceae bacterium]|nr:hypothetical protein [Lachnospiraceae bacterium]